MARAKNLSCWCGQPKRAQCGLCARHESERVKRYYLARRAGRAVEQHNRPKPMEWWEYELSESGLPGTCWRVLKLLKERGGADAAALRAALKVGKFAINRALGQLVEMEVVEVCEGVVRLKRF